MHSGGVKPVTINTQLRLPNSLELPPPCEVVGQEREYLEHTGRELALLLEWT